MKRQNSRNWQTQTTAPVEKVAPVVSAPVEAKVVESAPADIRQEKVTVVSGVYGLKTFSVVCGSFCVKANAEEVKQTLVNEGYNAVMVYNAEGDMYRVVIGTYDDRSSAASARDSFKAKHP